LPALIAYESPKPLWRKEVALSPIETTSESEPLSDRHSPRGRKKVAAVALSCEVSFSAPSVRLRRVVLGSGERLFDKAQERVALKLAVCRAYDDGVVSVTYQPTEH
jgi:hypothetical protein